MSRTTWDPPLPLLTVILVTTVGCGGGDPRCVARQALRDSVRAVDQAESAERSGNAEKITQQIAEAERLIAIARRNLSSSSTTSVERGMLEAAEYLDFVVGDFRSSGAVDATLTQFATRELNRAPAPGEEFLNC